jgi:hypothetical protein
VYARADGHSGAHYRVAAVWMAAKGDVFPVDVAQRSAALISPRVSGPGEVEIYAQGAVRGQ